MLQVIDLTYVIDQKLHDHVVGNLPMVEKSHDTITNSHTFFMFFFNLKLIYALIIDCYNDKQWEHVSFQTVETENDSTQTDIVAT